MLKQLFFDLETTGTDSFKHGIHQLAGAILIDGKTIETFDIKVQPNAGAVLDEEALAVSGITIDTLRTYLPILEGYNQFTTMLGKHVNKFDKTDKFFLCGYNNASFDNQFLRRWFDHCNDKYFGSWFHSNCLDVLVLASEHLKNVRHTMPNFQLKTVAKQMGIDVDESKLHDAMYDIHLTVSIYDLIVKPAIVEAV